MLQAIEGVRYVLDLYLKQRNRDASQMSGMHTKPIEMTVPGFTQNALMSQVVCCDRYSRGLRMSVEPHGQISMKSRLIYKLFEGASFTTI